MRKTNKPVAVAMALALVAALGIGATVAWLTDETDEVTNVFTVGDVDIDLYEHELDETGKALSGVVTREGEDGYKMVPGTVLPKDPTVVVEAGSEDCWVFVRVDQTANLSEFVEFGVDPANWTRLEGAGVEGSCSFWYCRAADVEADRMVKVIGYEDADGNWHANEVLVKPSVTKQMMGELTEETQPRLVFRACAVQYENLGTVEAAWGQVPAAFKKVS